MSIKSILFILGGLEEEVPALEQAFVLAKAFQARLCVLHITQQPDIYAGLYGEALAFSTQITAAIEERNSKRAEKSETWVTNLARKHQLAVRQNGEALEYPSVRFVHLTGEGDPLVAQYGRLSDLIVTGQDANYVRFPIVPALFDTGRPVLMIPLDEDTPSTWQNPVVSIAWDGSLSASKALHNAIPLMRNAASVSVILIQETRRNTDTGLERDVVDFLQAHGFEPSVVKRPLNGESVGEALLVEAKNVNSDFMVMGAYGHSMLRELILGGATQHVVEKADIPVLFSH